MWIGIDVGKTHHHACAIDSAGRVVWSARLANDQEEIESLLARARAGVGPVQWAIDLVSGESALLSAVLLAAGERVLYVPGRVVHRMSAALAGEGKTDAKDARVIAETSRVSPRQLRALTAADPILADLTPLIAYRTQLKADWGRGINRVRSQLATIFPGLERVVDLRTRTPWVLLTFAVTPAQIRALGQDAIADRLIAQGVRRPDAAKLATRVLGAAMQQTVQVPAETVVAELIMRQAKRLLELRAEIYALGVALAERFREHPKAEILESLPGYGPVIGTEVLLATGGGSLSGFATAGHLAAFAGLVPVPRDSGRISGNLRRPKRYNRRLRFVFYAAAFASLKSSPQSRAFYERKRAERHNHRQAVLALARRQVDVLWALLRDNRTYTIDPPTRAAIAA